LRFGKCDHQTQRDEEENKALHIPSKERNRN